MQMLRKGLPGILFVMGCLISTMCYALPLPGVGCFSVGGISGVSLPLNNITIRSDNRPGPGSVLYTTPVYTVSYRCQSDVYGAYTYQPTILRLPDFFVVSDALRKAGLALQLIVNGKTILYGDLLNNNLFPFGENIPPGTSDTGLLEAKVQLQIVVVTTLSGVISVPVPPLTAFKIVVGGTNYDTGVNINASGFQLQSIPGCFGRVSIRPAYVSLGHIYTGYPSSQHFPRQVPVTITAGQNQGCTGAFSDDYSIALSSTFSAPGQTMIQGSQAIALINGQGVPNGLALSLKDDAGNPVTFGRPAPFGSLSPTGRPGGGDLHRTFTANLDAIPGATLTTGDFSSDVVVTITYQ